MSHWVKRCQTLTKMNVPGCMEIKMRVKLELFLDHRGCHVWSPMAPFIVSEPELTRGVEVAAVEFSVPLTCWELQRRVFTPEPS